MSYITPLIFPLIHNGIAYSVFSSSGKDASLNYQKRVVQLSLILCAIFMILLAYVGMTKESGTGFAGLGTTLIGMIGIAGASTMLLVSGISYGLWSMIAK
jgi:hypothetical protein